MDDQGELYAEGTKTCLGADGQVVSQEEVSFVLPDQGNNDLPVVRVRMRAPGRAAIAGGANTYDGSNFVKYPNTGYRQREQQYPQRPGAVGPAASGKRK
jgi:hypothetical protein